MLRSAEFAQLSYQVHTRHRMHVALRVVLLALMLLTITVRPVDYSGDIAATITPYPSWLQIFIPYCLHATLLIATALCLGIILRGGFSNNDPGHNALVLSLVFLNIRIFEPGSAIELCSGIVFAITLAVFALQPRKYQDFLTERIVRRSSLLLFCVISTTLNLYLFQQGSGFFEGNSRFSGLSFHPNQLGAICSVTALISGMAIVCPPRVPEISKGLRFIAVLTFVGSVFLLLASGSRGAMLSFAMAILYILLCSGIGIRLLIGLVVAGTFCGAIFWNISTNSYDTLDRVLYTGDNRTEVFGWLMNAFLENPLVGAGTASVGSENAILKAFGMGGLICGVPFLAFLASRGAWVLVGFRQIFSTPLAVDYENIQDIGHEAIVLAILLSAIFDGYLFERMGFSALLISIASPVFGLRAYHARFSE